MKVNAMRDLLLAKYLVFDTELYSSYFGGLKLIFLYLSPQLPGAERTCWVSGPGK